jgi:putative ABC transport system permease protein
MKYFPLSFRLALSGIFENKIRAFLTMLGITIGIASVIIIMTIGAGAQSLITGSIEKIGTNLVGVLPGASDDKGPPASAMGIVVTTLTYDDAIALKKIPNVSGISAYAKGSGEISAGRESTDGMFNGITPDYPFVENHPVKQGRFFNENEERTAKKVAVLGVEIGEELFPFENAIGKKIKIKNTPFTVIGILEKKGGSFAGNPDTQVFIPLSTAQKIVLGQKHLGLIRARIREKEQIPVTMERIRQTLRYRHGIDNQQDDDFSVRSLDQAVEILGNIINGLRFFLASIAAISLIVGGIGITNIMLMMVKERTQEIGLKKAIGATPLQIKNQFLLEALLLTGIGGSIGIILGSGVSFLMSVIIQYMGYTWEFSLSFTALFISFSVAVIVGIVFGIHPARKAAHLNPIDALRYE